MESAAPTLGDRLPQMVWGLSCLSLLNFVAAGEDLGGYRISGPFEDSYVSRVHQEKFFRLDYITSTDSGSATPPAKY